MREDYKVSIIVPVYNVERYIERCMQSLYSQTYKNIEIILVDDESTDNSGSICDQYEKADSRIKVVHKKNAGLGMARNTGLKLMTGNYVMFVDSDDYIEKDAVERMLKIAVEYDAQVVTSNFAYDKRKEINCIPTGLYEGDLKVREVLIHMLGSKKGNNDEINVSSCTKLYLIKFLRDIRAQFPSEKNLIWEDMAFNCFVISKCKRVYVNDFAYYHYCYNQLSLTHKYNSDKFQNVMKMYQYMKTQIKHLDLPDEAVLRINNMFIGNVRTCMKLEAYYAKQNGKTNAIKNIYSMCLNGNLQELINEIPNEQMSIQQKIYNFFIRRKNPHLLYILATLQNWRKRNLIN